MIIIDISKALNLYADMVSPLYEHEKMNGCSFLTGAALCPPALRSGLSSPRLTMVTVIDGLPADYRKAVWHNRMQYAAKHKYK